MQVLTLVFGLSALLASVYAGGYTAKGGVFDFKKPLDYYDSAVNAGKAALPINTPFERFKVPLKKITPNKLLDAIYPYIDRVPYFYQ